MKFAGLDKHWKQIDWKRIVDFCRTNIRYISSGVVVVVFRYAWRVLFRCFVLVYVYAAAGLCVFVMACCVVFCDLLRLFNCGFLFF